MMKSLKWYLVTGASMAVVLAPLMVVANALVGEPPASLEALLEKSDFMYKRLEGGRYRLAVEGKGQVSVVVLSEKTMGWKDRNGNATKGVYLYCEVMGVPDGFRHPPAMLKRIAELNDSILFGNISINAESGSVFYNDSFWLRTADQEVLEDQAYLAHYTRLDLRKELSPYLEED